MKENSLTWQESRRQYATLFSCLSELINETACTLSDYEKANMDFAHKMFNDELMRKVEHTGCFEEYTRQFKAIHEQLQRQIDYLNEFKEKMQLLMLRDHVNYPTN